MRCSTIRAGRVLTIFSLVTLLLAFAVVVDASPAPSPYGIVLKRADPADSNNGTTNAQPQTVSQPPVVTTTPTTPTTSPPPITTPTPTSTISTSPTTSTTPTTPTTTTTPTSTLVRTTTSTPTTTSTTPTTTSTSSTLIATMASNTTSTTPTGTTLLVSGIPSTLNNGGTTLIATNIGQFTTSPTAVDPIETIDANSAGNTSSGTTKSFLKNTGAMAATFTIIGLIAAAALTAGFMVWRKKRRSEERDIFDSEYKDFNVDSPSKTNDVASLGDGASISGYSQHIDTGYNVAPAMSGLASNRSSTVSNHAGYGAFKNRNQQQAQAVQPPAATRQHSALRNEVQVSSRTLYQEPAVDENQSIYLMPHSTNHDSHYSADSLYSSGKGNTSVGTAQ